MRIAMTGCSGFIGSVAAAHLAQAGHQVTGLMRSSSRRDHVAPYLDRCIEGSMSDRDAFEPLLDGADVLVHGAVDWRTLRDGDFADHLDANLVAGIELLNAAAERGQRIVLLSSVAVHHAMSDRWNGQVDDEHPLRPGTMYGALKASLEDHLWALHASKGTSFVSLRPSAVYGIDPSLDRSIGAPILKSIAQGTPYTRTGGGKFVHVDDVAASIVAALDRPAGQPGIYHLADCYARWAEWASMACDILGTSVDIDDSSPTAPKNMFTHDALEAELGIKLERGHDGIRTHLQQLQQRMAAQ